MSVAEVEDRKGQPGRPPVGEENLMDARFSVSFPRARYPELQRKAHRQGLNVSAFVRQALLHRLDELAE